MIQFDKFILANGLKVIVHRDTSTPIVAMNILYNVGARDEQLDKTGFAHLFEHLMFGGSANIPDYDEPLECAGGENNAFTTNDITNYYLTIPKPNLETAFWLESDRMLELAFSPKSLRVQRDVVTEEFNESHLNQPYGDVWLLLRPLAYKVHPYQWSTIGKEISHIQNAKLDEVKAFYQKYYNPNNAIMVVAGDVETEEIKQLAEKWFGLIPRGGEYLRNLPAEPPQTTKRTLTVERNVPYDAIYLAYHMCNRFHADYYPTDLLSEVLSGGDSSRLEQELIKKQRLFSEINAWITGDIDEGLFIISGKLVSGVAMDKAEAAIVSELEKLQTETTNERELQKIKNKMESMIVFSEMKVLEKAMGLAYAELMGDASFYNEEMEHYMAVNAEDLRRVARRIFIPGNCSAVYYLAKKS
jgi:predicted Zn-dependent peptidase